MNDPVVQVVGHVPEYKTSGSVGADLVAAIDKAIEVYPGHIKLVPTGTRVAIPHGYEGQIRCRSGMALDGLVVVNSPGTIDADFRGTIGVILGNIGSEPQLISPGQRIAQLVIAPVLQAKFVPADSLDATNRGASGFGSTGKG